MERIVRLFSHCLVIGFILQPQPTGVAEITTHQDLHAGAIIISQNAGRISAETDVVEFRLIVELRKGKFESREDFILTSSDTSPCFIQILEKKLVAESYMHSLAFAKLLGETA